MTDSITPIESLVSSQVPSIRLDDLAARGQLSWDLAVAAGRVAARRHSLGGRRADRGGVAGMRLIIDATRAALRNASGVDAAAVEQLHSDWSAAIARNTMLLEIRRADGWVREFQGDLSLRNMTLAEGRVTVFDADENEPATATDVLFDLALLLVELVQLDLAQQANTVLNAWLDRLPQHDALMLLPLFLSVRAAGRADDEGAQQAAASLSAAVRLLQPAGGAIVAVGGLSGAGKTTLARRIATRLADAPGAIVLRSDASRRRLFGVDEEKLRSPSYDPSVARSIYRLLAREAHDVARAGYVAIVDAVFGLEEWRHEIRRAAERAGVRVIGMWLDAPMDVLESRVRQSRGEAGIRVLHKQAEVSSPPDEFTRIDASADMDVVADAAVAAWSSAQAGA